MADTLKRYLLITRRRIPLDRKEDYALLWHEVQRVVHREGARAWIFRSARTDDRFTEFIEWQAHEGRSPLDHSDIAEAVAALNAAFPYEESDTWKEDRL